jgi:hypothetical protein
MSREVYGAITEGQSKCQGALDRAVRAAAQTGLVVPIRASQVRELVAQFAGTAEVAVAQHGLDAIGRAVPLRFAVVPASPTLRRGEVHVLTTKVSDDEPMDPDEVSYTLPCAVVVVVVTPAEYHEVQDLGSPLPVGQRAEELCTSQPRTERAPQTTAGASETSLAVRAEDLAERFIAECPPAIAETMLMPCREVALAIVRLDDTFVPRTREAEQAAARALERGDQVRLEKAKAKLDKFEEEYDEQRRALVWSIEHQAIGTLAARDRSWLRAEREQAKANVADLSKEHRRADELVRKFDGYLSAPRTPEADTPEGMGVRGKAGQIERRALEVEAALGRAGKIKEKLDAAWLLLRLQERNQRVAATGWTMKCCRSCERPLPDDRIAWCSPGCETRRDDGLVAGARRCAWCQRSCRPATPVLVFDETAILALDEVHLQPYEVWVCGRPCWDCLVVDQDEAPEFVEPVFAGPAPHTEREKAAVRRAEQAPKALAAGTAEGEPVTRLGLPARTSALDRYVAYLKGCGSAGATDAEAAKAIGHPKDTVRWCRAKAKTTSRVVSDGQRPARWRLA